MSGLAVHSTRMALAQAVKDSITAEMERQGISQRRLARELGMSQQYFWRRISSAERADLEFTPSEIERIAAVLGVPATAFLALAAAST